MKIFKTNFIVKIPSYIKMYSYFNEMLIFRYRNKLIYLNFCYKLIFFVILNVNVFIVSTKNYLIGSNLVLHIKKILYNLTKKVYKKLMLIGIGYKVLQVKLSNNMFILIFKLGFSHCFYFKFLNNNFIIIRQSKIYLKSRSLKQSLFISNKIKQLKSLTKYNKKGIFYYNEI